MIKPLLFACLIFFLLGSADAWGSDKNGAFEQVSDALEEMTNSTDLLDNIKVARDYGRDLERENSFERKWIVMKLVKLDDLAQKLAAAEVTLDCDRQNLLPIVRLSEEMNTKSKSNPYLAPNSAHRLNRLVIDTQQRVARRCFDVWAKKDARLELVGQPKLANEALSTMLFKMPQSCAKEPWDWNEPLSGLVAKLDCANFATADFLLGDTMLKSMANYLQKMTELTRLSEVDALGDVVMFYEQLIAFFNFYVRYPCKLASELDASNQEMYWLAYNLSKNFRMDNSFFGQLMNVSFLERVASFSYCQRFISDLEEDFMHRLQQYIEAEKI